MCSFVYSSSRCSVPVFVQGASASGVAVFRVVVVAAAIAALGYWLKKKAMKRASNQCNMTFSRPKYVPVPVAGYPGREGGGEGEIVAGDNLGYGYRLMRYMDGRLPASDKADPLRPRGIPVLFVPGHLGKYDQVCVFVCVWWSTAVARRLAGSCCSCGVPFCVVLSTHRWLWWCHLSAVDWQAVFLLNPNCRNRERERPAVKQLVRRHAQHDSRVASGSAK